MIDKTIGFLWGCATATLMYDFYSEDINIYWWVWAILFMFIFITTVIAEIYSFITDYKAMAETGWSLTKKIYMWASKKWVKQYSNKM